MKKPAFVLRDHEFDQQKFEQLCQLSNNKLYWDYQFYDAEKIGNKQFLFYNHRRKHLLLCQINKSEAINHPQYSQLFESDIIISQKVDKSVFFYDLGHYNGTKFFDFSTKFHQRRVGVLRHHYNDPLIQNFLAGIEVPKHFQW